MRAPEFRNATVSGYQKAEVDAFVLRVIRALDEPKVEDAVSCSVIAQMHFPSAWLGSGYRKGDVDLWLDEAEYELHQSRL